jgi:hypothetical protein
MRELLRQTADLAADFLESVPDRPVFPRVGPDELRARLGGPLPEDPTDPSSVVADLAARRVREAMAAPLSAAVSYAAGWPWTRW